jgi:hypothetical protein
MDDTRICLSETRCKAYDPVGKHACPTTDPLCPACLDDAGRHTRSLVYDYLDLAQLHEAAMSQAITEKTAGSKEKQMLLVAHVEALQAEMVHVATTWEYEVRVAAHLSDPSVLTPIADWHTTLSKPPPPAKMRGGAQLQRAVGILGLHLRALSLIPATAVCPTGAEDDPVDVAGWEAVLQIAGLHGRAKSTLGRTRRTFWIPGECWACKAKPVQGVDGPLLRSEPLRFEDPMQVGCDRCHATRPYPDYEIYMTGLLWPDTPTDALVRIAA